MQRVYRPGSLSAGGHKAASSIVRGAVAGPALFTGPGCRADGSKVMAVVAGVCEDNVFLVVVGVSA